MDFVDFINNVFEGSVEISTQPFKTKEEAIDLAEKALPTLKRILTKVATTNSRVVCGIKSISSIENKLERWKESGRTIETMFDILRGTVATETQEDAEKVVKRLSRGPVVAKYEIKQDPDKFGYYGSHHIDIYLPEFKMVAEVQIMTKKLQKAKKIGHEIYSKYRSEKEPPEDVLNKSKEIYRLGNKPKFVSQKKPRHRDFLDF
jgi:ppGpp synthetase/RelA/SpoT-type nucleotidyltranferase